MIKLKNKLTNAFYIVLVAVFFTSCTKKKEGMIVKDSKGVYYEVTGVGALGSERYMLNELDTTRIKPVGFNCN